MNSNRYTPGSVAQLLNTEAPTSGKETKLQAVFSKPAAQSLGLQIRTKSVSRTLSVTHTPPYLSDDCLLVAEVGRHLRLADAQTYVVPRTIT